MFYKTTYTCSFLCIQTSPRAHNFTADVCASVHVSVHTNNTVFHLLHVASLEFSLHVAQAEKYPIQGERCVVIVLGVSWGHQNTGL